MKIRERVARALERAAAVVSGDRWTYEPEFALTRAGGVRFQSTTDFVSFCREVFPGRPVEVLINNMGEPFTGPPEVVAEMLADASDAALNALSVRPAGGDGSSLSFAFSNYGPQGSLVTVTGLPRADYDREAKIYVDRHTTALTRKQRRAGAPVLIPRTASEVRSAALQGELSRTAAIWGGVLGILGAVVVVVLERIIFG